MDEGDLRDAHAAYSVALFRKAFHWLDDAGSAEDAVQESFHRAWQSRERFDPELGSLRTWLFAILRNVLLDFSRARAARPSLSNGGVEEEAMTDPLQETLSSWEIEEAMRRISDNHRRVLIETYYHGRPYLVVAKELRIPQGTVKSRVFYALKELRSALEEIGYEG